jgi:flagellar hook-basal body complex protein FliE
MIAALPLVASALTAAGGAATTSSAAVSAAQTSLQGAGDSFSSMLASFSQDTVNKLKNSEQMSISGIQGNATTQSVVESVIAAQESLQTALAVRDKAVNAFQDISKMPI